MNCILAFILGASALIRLNGQPINVEIASTEEERAHGLMERQQLPDGSGMLFVYSEPQTLSFWMKNTNIPLSIGFFDEERRLINVENMDPPDGSFLRIYKSNKEAKFALEVPQGWFEKHHIQPKMIFDWEFAN